MNREPNGITIIGAGLAGLLAAIMMRSDVKEIWEAQTGLPNNHHSLLRFRSPAVADATGIAFKEVKVMKAILHDNNPIADAVSYSKKVTGEATLRSIMSVTGAIERRYIAPSDLISQMAERLPCPIIYGKTVQPWHLDLEGMAAGNVEPIISTIPMPALAHLLKYPHADELKFRHRSHQTLAVKLMADFPIDLYATIYVPSPLYRISRISITGDILHIEVPDVIEVNPSYAIAWALPHFGLRTNQIRTAGDEVFKAQRYGKINEIDDGARKRFIIWATDNYNIYSLGRFATWRPGLLLDDVVNDVKVISNLIKHGRYNRRLITSNRN